MKTIRTIEQKEIAGIIDYLAHIIKEDNWKPDIIVTMAKGGLIPARLLARTLNITRILSFGISFYDHLDQKTETPIIYQGLDGSIDFLIDSNILLIDDIADTGSSFKCCVEHLHDLGVPLSRVRTCSLFYKPKSKILPNYRFELVDDGVWLHFPWE